VGRQPLVDLPVGHVVVGAQQVPEDLGVEVGVVGDVARLAAERGYLSVGEQIADEAAVDGGGDRPDGLADDHDPRGVGIVLDEASPQVARSAPRTLSRWRHRFEPGWDDTEKRRSEA
jgi:hypothetical protein